MKKAIAGILAAMLLAGCGAQEPPVFETEGTVSPSSPRVKPTAGEIGVWLPEEAVSEAMAEEGGSQVYTWDEYEMRIQTMDGGDIHRTLEQLTGMEYEELTVMNRAKGELELYQTVWCAAGEDGTLVGKAVVADDGNYHYCVSLISPEDVDSTEVYERICDTLAVVDPDAKK